MIDDDDNHHHPARLSLKLCLLLAAALTLACGAQEAEAPAEVQRALTASEPGQGVGDDGFVLGTCVSGVPTVTEAERATFSLAIAASAEDAHRLLSGSVGGKVAFARGAVRLEARATFADDLVEKSNQLTLALYTEVEVRRTAIDPVNSWFRVTPQDPRFGDLCGSAAVGEVVHGGRAIAAIAYRFKSARRKTEFSASMKAAFKKGLARAELTSELRRLTETFSGDVDLRVSLWQDGGAAVDLLTAVRGAGAGTTPESAADATIACGQADAAACIDVVQRVLSYLYSDKLVQSFRAQPAPIGFSTVPWSAFRQIEPVLLPAGVIRARRNLDQKLEELLDLRSALKTQRVFGTTRKDLERRLWDNETAILLAVRDCYDRIQAAPHDPAGHLACEASAANDGLAAFGYQPLDEQLFAVDDYDAFLDFCDAPPCAGVWEYLDLGAHAGAAAAAMPPKHHSDGRRGYEGASHAHIDRHYGRDPIDISGDTRLRNDRLYMHPGFDRAMAVLRFTSPRDGEYEFTFLADGASYGRGTSTDFELIQAGERLHTLDVIGYGPSSRVGGSRRVVLRRGEAIDFRVTDGGNGYLSDTTGVLVTANRL